MDNYALKDIRSFTASKLLYVKDQLFVFFDFY